MSFALSILLKGSVIVLLAAVIARASERNAARVALVWRLAFVAVITLPILAAFLPTIELAAVDMPHETFTSSILAWVPALWITGCIVALARLALDYRSASRIVERSALVTDPRILSLFSRAFALSRSVKIPELRQTAGLPTAALIGFSNPVVLIPVEAIQWSDDEIVAVMCHELEHLRHNDWMVMILERVVVCLLWINPLIHFAFRSSSVSREIVADDAVVRSTVSIERYAQRLISVARIENRRAASLALSGHRPGTETRVHALFESRRQRRTLSFRTQAVVAMLAAPLLVTVSAAQPWRCIPAAVSAITVPCP